MQRGFGPLARVPVGTTLLLRRLLAVLAPGAVPNTGELLQADKTRGVGVQDALADRVVGIQRSPVSSFWPSAILRRVAKPSALQLEVVFASGRNGLPCCV